MIYYLFGELHYSAPLVWFCSGALVLAIPVGAHCFWHLNDLPPEMVAPVLLALDHACAATLCWGCNYWLLTMSLTPHYLIPDGRPELFALRAASAVVAACSSVCLVAYTLPRFVLYAGTALYVGLGLNISVWWASLWLHLQDEGLASLLPPSLVHLLAHERPIDWLRKDMVGHLLTRCRQLLPLLVLPEEDLHHGLAILPPHVREALEARGLGRLVLPVSLRRLLLEPWASGPYYLRVRGVASGQSAGLMLGSSRSSSSSSSTSSTSSTSRSGTSSCDDSDCPEPDAAASARTRGPHGVHGVHGGINGGVNGRINGGVNGMSSVTGVIAVNGHASAAAPTPTLPVPPRAAPTDTTPFAPEWLCLYALRRHCARALVGDRWAGLLLRSTGGSSGSTLVPSTTKLAVAVGAVVLTSGWLLRGAPPGIRRRAATRRYALPAAIAAAAALYLLQLQRDRRRASRREPLLAHEQ